MEMNGLTSYIIVLCSYFQLGKFSLRVFFLHADGATEHTHRFLNTFLRIYIVNISKINGKSTSSVLYMSIIHPPFLVHLILHPLF